MNTANQKSEIAQVAKVIPGAAKGVYSTNLDSKEKLDILHLLKGNNLDTEGGISTEGMGQVALSESKNADRYILQEGDVVVMARGSAIRAAFVTKQVAESRVIASANFIIVRPHQDKVLGEVIVAYLNSAIGQYKLLGLSVGSVMPNITTSALKELQIPVPPFPVQQKISEFFCANQEAYQATLALAEQQKRTVDASILNMMLGAA